METLAYGYFYVDMTRIHSQIMVLHPGRFDTETREPDELFMLVSPIRVSWKRQTAIGAVEDALVALYVEILHRLQKPEYKGGPKHYVVIVEIETELLDQQFRGHVYRVKQ